MIYNTLAEAKRLNAVHPGFAAAFEFLNRHDLDDLPEGTYEIDGKRVYAMVQEYQSIGRDKARLETHRRYIDIQYTIAGDEVIGCRHVADCTPDADGWIDEKDVCFYTDASDYWLPIPAGRFAIFFPEEDAHAPMAGSGRVRKVVVKIEA